MSKLPSRSGSSPQWAKKPTKPPRAEKKSGLLGGSWDLVTRVTSKVTIVIIAYSPN